MTDLMWARGGPEVDLCIHKCPARRKNHYNWTIALEMSLNLIR